MRIFNFSNSTKEDLEDVVFADVVKNGERGETPDAVLLDGE